MTESINLYDAKTQLSSLVDRAAAGEEFILAKAGRPLARLVPYSARTTPRVPGGLEGQVWISDDFNDPLPGEIMDAFNGGPTE